jgi:hypothetical protein
MVSVDTVDGRDTKKAPAARAERGRCAAALCSVESISQERADQHLRAVDVRPARWCYRGERFVRAGGLVRATENGDRNWRFTGDRR